MIEKITFVCIANYCRSPAAEKLMQLKNTDLTVSSCGIIPYTKYEMDHRTAKYLKNKGIDDLSHTPKLPMQNLQNSDLVIVFDTRIINELKNKYKIELKKIKLYNFINPAVSVQDPFKIKDLNSYFAEMDKISDLVDDWYQYLQEKSI